MTVFKLLLYAPVLLMSSLGFSQARADTSSSLVYSGDYLITSSGVGYNKNCELDGTDLPIIDQSIAELIHRSSVCWDTFHLLEAREVIRALPRVRLDCVKTRSFIGQAHTIDALGLHTAFTDPEWHIDTTEGSYTDATLLFHEMTHFMPANNCSEHDLGGCDGSDRIYFLQGLCTPGEVDSWADPHLEQTCMDSLTKMSLSSTDRFEQLFLNGEPMALPYKVGDALAICSSIQTASDHFQELIAQMESLERKLEQADTWLSTQDAYGAELKEQLKELLTEVRAQMFGNSQFVVDQNRRKRFLNSWIQFPKDFFRHPRPGSIASSGSFLSPEGISNLALSAQSTVEAQKPLLTPAQLAALEMRLLPVLKQAAAVSEYMKTPQLRFFTK